MGDPASKFVHLHIHTNYSMLDGALRIDRAVQRASQYGMPAMAITDHGNMFGAIHFYKAARAAGIKPIIGTEAYVARGSRRDKSERPYHLILLAKDETGYGNLLYLCSMAYKEGFYRRPRIDHELLAERARGLVGMSACMAGEVPRSFQEGGVESAVRAASRLKEIFSPGDFYFEVQNTGHEMQIPFNGAARDIAKRAGLDIVASNDVHYLDADDARAHEVLVCIGTGKVLGDSDRLYKQHLSIHFGDEAHMRSVLPEFPDAIENTLAVAEKCEIELRLGDLVMPHFPVPDGETLDGHLTALASEGLARRVAEIESKGGRVDRPVYEKRLARELGVICKMGYAGYFLIVWDFIQHAKRQLIPVGPGRGSGGGSVAAWALRITDLDPIRYGLVFERFLNPDRVSMPDFDIDFCKNRRDEVIDYVTRKYGEDNVAQIATFHELKSKLVVRDVGRVLGLPYVEVDRIAKMIPAPVQGKTVTIDQALKEEPRLRKLYKSNAKIKELIDLSRRLEGLTRHAGTHAAGIVIADRPIHEYAPLYQRSVNGERAEISTQWDKNVVEDIGLVKFDFLGLKTLTVLDTALKLIHKNRQGGPAIPSTLSEIPLEDPETFRLIASGDTTGVFQLESRGFRELLRRLKPKRIEDIIAAVALYRPGPLQSGTADSYIDRKNGLEPVSFAHQAMRAYLEETYGVMIYQEQVMETARVLAGFTMAEADNLRRAMGKKKHDLLAKFRSKFLVGCDRNEVDQRVAESIFDQMQEFASYAFNKSHSAGYAIIAYQTAYLKAHFREEFFAALMTCDEDKIEKLVPFLAEGRAKGISILPPDINTSDRHFTVIPAEDGKGRSIRFGLLGVKGVGAASVDAIIKARDDGPFEDLFDLCSRVDLRACNRSNIDQLVRAGAFDEAGSREGLHRARILAALDAALEVGKMRMRDREEGQTDLLGMLAAAGGDDRGPGRQDYPPVKEAPHRELLAWEKAALGCYVTGHPLDRFQSDISRLASTTISGLVEIRSEATVTVAGMIEGFRERTTRGGKSRLAFLMLEDAGGRVEVVVPPAVYSETEDKIRAGMDSPILVKATVEHPDDSGPGFEGSDEAVIRLVLQDLDTIETVRRTRTREVHIYAQVDGLPDGAFPALKTVLGTYPGRCPVVLHLRIPGESETEMVLSNSYRVTPADGLIDDIEHALEGVTVELR
ncbi:MAG: DNA polymerase III subunit alpha [Deltaproteobacteria bacterium]|nr:DNA polymerase III subunit alpha [Deltaproteobacteria bacterium]